MIAAVTYSTEDYQDARKYNVKMAYKKGKVDQVFEYTNECITEEFRNKNKKILNCKRGAGYWLWKPYVVNNVLEQLKTNDYLFYCDSGAFLIKDLHILVKYMDNEKTDLMIFQLPFIEKNWTKRDIFIELSCDKKQFTDSMQRCATYFLLKKTDNTVKLMNEWLEYAQKYELISDENNLLYGQPNYEGFRDNRHDQSILSVLSKKYGYKAYEDISQFRYPRKGKERIIQRYKTNKEKVYPIMICLHRQKKADFTTSIREHILNYIPSLKRILHYGYH